MLAARAKGTEGNLFPLWSTNNCKLTFDKSINKRHLSGLYSWPTTSITEKNIIAKHDSTFLGEEILEFFMAPKVKHALVFWCRRSL